ncbi:MAG: nucleotide exchange factor GrpE, partial [Treponema sp.]|nr:nucleotide exchange factor GrpE [Treponema sp.]
MSKHHSHGNREETPEAREAAEDRPASPAAETVPGGVEAACGGKNSAEIFTGTPEERPSEASPGPGMKESPVQDGSGTEDDAAENSAEKIADLETRLAEAEDQFLRKAADFENFRKRMNREKQDAIDFANQSLL